MRTNARTYQELDTLLGHRTSRKVGNNTYALRLSPQSIGIRLHDTVVIELFSNGTCCLNSGGWQTVTTKDWINTYLPYPFRLVQEKRRWYIDQLFHATNGEGRARIRRGEYRDGVRLGSEVLA